MQSLSMAAIGSSGPRHVSGRKLTLEESGVCPDGLREVLQPEANEVHATSHLYVVEMASSNRGRVVHKVGSTKNVHQRIKEIRTCMNVAGRYKNWTVVLSALLPQQGHIEASVHDALRAMKGAQVCSFPVFSTGHGPAAGNSKEV